MKECTPPNSAVVASATVSSGKAQPMISRAEHMIVDSELTVLKYFLGFIAYFFCLEKLKTGDASASACHGCVLVCPSPGYPHYGVITLCELHAHGGLVKNYFFNFFISSF